MFNPWFKCVSLEEHSEAIPVSQWGRELSYLVWLISVLSLKRLLLSVFVYLEA